MLRGQDAESRRLEGDPNQAQLFGGELLHWPSGSRSRSSFLCGPRLSSIVTLGLGDRQRCLPAQHLNRDGQGADDLRMLAKVFGDERLVGYWVRTVRQRSEDRQGLGEFHELSRPRIAIRNRKAWDSTLRHAWKPSFIIELTDRSAYHRPVSVLHGQHIVGR